MKSAYRCRQVGLTAAAGASKHQPAGRRFGKRHCRADGFPEPALGLNFRTEARRGKAFKCESSQDAQVAVAEESLSALLLSFLLPALTRVYGPPSRMPEGNINSHPSAPFTEGADFSGFFVIVIVRPGE